MNTKEKMYHLLKVYNPNPEILEEAKELLKDEFARGVAWGITILLIFSVAILIIQPIY